MFDTLTVFARHFGYSMAALLLATALSIAPAAAQKKPENVGKPDFAGKGAGEAEKGERGRSDAAKEMARERGQGEKKGLAKQENKGQDANKDAAKDTTKDAADDSVKADKDKKAKKSKPDKKEKKSKKDKDVKDKGKS
jgi:hypothetical protein